jgi:hypothetical protein
MQPVLALTNYCCVLSGEAANTNFICFIVFGSAQTMIFHSQDERSITVTPRCSFVDKDTTI